MIGICYKGVLFPLYWKMLEKKGNSNTEERIELVKEFIGKFGAESIKYLAADREFIGQEWFKYLIKNNIDFRIRIKDNTLVQNRRGMTIAVCRLFSNLGVNSLLGGLRGCKPFSVFVKKCQFTRISIYRISS